MFVSQTLLSALVSRNYSVRIFIRGSTDFTREGEHVALRQCRSITLEPAQGIGGFRAAFCGWDQGYIVTLVSG